MVKSYFNLLMAQLIDFDKATSTLKIYDKDNFSLNFENLKLLHR